LTGSNADKRITVSPQEENNLIVNLLAQLQKLSGEYYLPQGQKLPTTNLDLVSSLAKKLMDKKGRSLVVSGSQDKHVQILINAINSLLNNYGKTLVVKENPYFKGPNDLKMSELVSNAQKGKVGAVLFWDSNPLYDFGKAEELSSALQNVEVKVSFASAPDETSKACTHIMPNNHFLESWNDYFSAPGVLSFAQPVIQPLFGSRMVQESLLKLAGKKADYYNYLKETSKNNFFKYQSKFLSFTDFWSRSVHDGVVVLKERYNQLTRFNKTSASTAFAALKKIDYKDGSSLVCYQKISMRLGKMANNPWLQELPDPITKVTWDNYFLVSVKKAKSMGLKTGDEISVDSGNYKLTLPVVVQPGVSENIIGVALGYGHHVGGKVAKDVGGNAYPFMQYRGKNLSGTVHGIKVSKTGTFKALALTQTHHSMEGRDIVRETTLKDWKNNQSAGNPPQVKLISLWPKHDQTGHQWAMAIDLNKCTGCSGCIISCNAENNVPVVGREEVKNRREMHWLRIDRYYKGDDENPEVVHQPLMCQHCDNAPCETVCPVLATVQSSDGLNQQVYNRCVGTRYCANNCPYKVRRFNWFDYAHDDKYANMVLNPDVLVRSRGVMEKCSMCIQRIQEGKLQAKIDGRALKDGEIKMACQQSCPGDAIVFGDINDPKSQVSKLLKNARNYRLLEELNVRPRVNYLTKVRNKG
ncbi:MAG: molybdopterin oxidoreductase, partial [Epsilonproteobacteria bacterium]